MHVYLNITAKTRVITGIELRAAVPTVEDVNLRPSLYKFNENVTLHVKKDDPNGILYMYTL